MTSRLNPCGGCTVASALLLQPLLVVTSSFLYVTSTSITVVDQTERRRCTHPVECNGRRAAEEEFLLG